MSGRLSDAEKQQLATDGYVVREAVFDEVDIDILADASEELVADLVRMATAPKWEVGSYVFQLDALREVTIKWEDDKTVVQGLEPFAHLHPTFYNYAFDPRFIDPMKDVVGVEKIDLFTEKLNLKRARAGGPIILHQDYPYWINVADDVDRVGTAMLFLDEATVDNGCLEVSPGSHLDGMRPRKNEVGFGALEMDTDAFDLSTLIPVEVPAGSLVMFGPLLVHRSLPNLSGADRRALLYSYQPAGNRHSLEELRKNFTSVASSNAGS